MPETLYTASPQWGSTVVLYCFVGGIAGGCFFIASVLKLFGRPEDGPVIRMGSYAALVGAVAGALLLTIGLARPDRFWHVVIEANHGGPMFKAWSPVSVGAWALLLFGVFAGLAALGALAEEGRVKLAALAGLARGDAAVVIAAAGSLLGLFLAGNTGVLLSVTNRPLWAHSSLLGALFLLSAVSMGAGSLRLLCRWRQQGTAESLDWVSQLDRRALVLQLIALVAFVVSLGPAARVFLGWWGAVLLIGVLGAGMLAPLMLESRWRHDERSLHRAAMLVLTGGFLLRVVVIFAPDAVPLQSAAATGP